jgi:ABC-type multidrug transport system fused ATPase/permease subunit
MDKEKLFEITLGIRNFEIGMFWKRSNYFLVLNTTLAVGFFTVKEPYVLYVGFLGLLVCFLWFAVTLGGKFWQSRWEHQLYKIEMDSNISAGLFTQNHEDLKTIVSDSLNYNKHNIVRKQFDKLVLLKPSVSYMMMLLSVFSILFWIIVIASKLDINYEVTMRLFQQLQIGYSNTDNIFWLFSAAAQSISAFVALLLTGFALVLTIMNNIEQKDETLSEILHVLKNKYYIYIKYLAVLTGLAIILSLLSVYINNSLYAYRFIVFYITSIFDLVAIIGGILFIIYIINPNKYRNLANKLYKEEAEKIGAVGEEVDGINFIQLFIKLEKLLRDIILDQKRDILIEKQIPRLESIPFRGMLEILLSNEVINKDEYNKLLEISKLRNLVVHGKRDKVNPKFISLLSEMIDNLKDRT